MAFIVYKTFCSEEILQKKRKSELILRLGYSNFYWIYESIMEICHQVKLNLVQDVFNRMLVRIKIGSYHNTLFFILNTNYLYLIYNILIFFHKPNNFLILSSVKIFKKYH